MSVLSAIERRAGLASGSLIGLGLGLVRSLRSLLEMVGVSHPFPIPDSPIVFDGDESSVIIASCEAYSRV